MSFGMIALLVLSLLTLFGLGQRVLDRLHLSDRTALFAMAAIFVGGLIPPIPIGRVRLGIGGCLVPVALCVWTLVRAGSGKERARALIGSVLTGAAVWLILRLMPAEPEKIVIDPLYIGGIVAGLIAWALGRSRRGAFICAVLGVLLADTASAVQALAAGADAPVRLGTGGALDAVVISAIIAVLLAELVGEAVERLSRGKEGAR